MAIASGIYRQIRIKKQDALKTPATTTGGQKLRFRPSTNVNLNKQQYSSDEVRTSQQEISHRHGSWSISGSLDAHLSPTTYTDVFENVMRGTFAATSAYSAGIDVTAAEAAPQIVDASGGLITADLKVGMVVRFSGFTATDNNDKDFVITALTATNMSGYFADQSLMVAEAAGNAITITPTGKGLSIPTSGHTKTFFTIEEFQSDISQSERLYDCQFGGFNLNCAANALAEISFPILGLDFESATSAYFTAPAEETTTDHVELINGILKIDNTDAYITSFSLNVNGNVQNVGGVAGSKIDPDLLRAGFVSEGSMTVLFADAFVRDKFVNEVEGNLVVSLASSTEKNGGLIVLSAPRIKFNSWTKGSSGAAISATVNFKLLQPKTGGAGYANNNSSLTIYDTTVV